jgi:antitoxin CptB
MQLFLLTREIEMTDQSPREPLDIRRSRLQFRCWHRGTQEIDLVLGSFAEMILERLDGTELERFEALLDCTDVDLFDWIFVGIAPPPQHDHQLIWQLRGFSAARHHRSRQSAQH